MIAGLIVLIHTPAKPTQSYRLMIALSVLTGLGVFVIAPLLIDARYLLYFSLAPYFLLTAGIHALMAQLIPSFIKASAGAIIYPMLMGAIFVLLLLFHIFVVMPLAYPDFLNALVQ